MSTAEQAERTRTAFEALSAAFRAMADQARLAIEAVGKLMRERREARVALAIAAQREWDALSPEQRRARAVASRSAARTALEKMLRQP